jgi:hypothetical protein
MAKVSFDRDSLVFTARRLTSGIEVEAEFQAPKLSSPDEGAKYYSVTLTIDHDTRGVSGRNWGVSRRAQLEPTAYKGGKDLLRLLEKQVRDEVLKSDAWTVLVQREADPNYVVNEYGKVVVHEKLDRRF